ncbi:unnamed protein product [Pedinophyceae sp. YPF-701]|nr:unnamed protein product [Pedinophyceae sp. YPF-701]
MVVKLVQTEIEGGQELESLLAQTGLKVIEVYSEWAGPCLAVIPSLKSIRQELDDEQSLTFFKIKAETCKAAEDPAQKVECNELVAERRGKSEPRFLVYRNGHLMACVNGVNTPIISRVSKENYPMGPDADKLDDNGILQARKARAEAAKGGAGKGAATRRRRG